MENKKRILLITTGGTIVCRDRGRGLVPVLSAQDLLRHVPNITKNCEVDTLELFRLDSTDMTPAEWTRVASEIYQRIDGFDGFVVIFA